MHKWANFTPKRLRKMYTWVEARIIAIVSETFILVAHMVVYGKRMHNTYAACHREIHSDFFCMHAFRENSIHCSAPLSDHSSEILLHSRESLSFRQKSYKMTLYAYLAFLFIAPKFDDSPAKKYKKEPNGWMKCVGDTHGLFVSDRIHANTHKHAVRCGSSSWCWLWSVREYYCESFFLFLFSMQRKKSTDLLICNDNSKCVWHDRERIRLRCVACSGSQSIFVCIMVMNDQSGQYDVKVRLSYARYERREYCGVPWIFLTAQ